MMFPQDNSLNWPTLKQHNSSMGRVYEVLDGPHTGAVYPSITRVLGAKPKPFLEEWRKRVGAEEAAKITQRAAAMGTALHKLMECHCGNEPLPTYGPHVLEVWKHARPWFDKHVVKVYCQERDIYSHRLKVAGRLDLLAEVTDLRGISTPTIAVVDLKSSKGEKREAWIEDYYIQGSFYALAVYELTGAKVRKIVFPIVSPDGVQTFVTAPLKHLDKLIERIDYFYDHQAA